MTETAPKRPLTDSLMRGGAVECRACGSIVARTKAAQERHMRLCEKKEQRRGE